VANRRKALQDFSREASERVGGGDFGAATRSLFAPPGFRGYGANFGCEHASRAPPQAVGVRGAPLDRLG
jgi:hypothetical protein